MLLFALGALILLPWVGVLVVELPSAHRAAHWDIAWAGFDVGLAVLLATVAVTAWRRSPWFEGAATATATLLFVDAWFDVLTSTSGAELTLAIGEALLVELPLAVLCLFLARDAERRLRVPVGDFASTSGTGAAVLSRETPPLPKKKPRRFSAFARSATASRACLGESP